MSDETQRRPSGRQAQAARNDERILAAARAVFTEDPKAPIATVAERAGVGISALYGRYGGKEDLLRTLAADGLALFVELLESALVDDRDAWSVLTDFMTAAVDADTSSLTLALAGTFTPTAEMYAQADRSAQLFDQLFTRVAPALRGDIAVHDLSMALQVCAAVRVHDLDERHTLRRRYLVLLLEGMRSTQRPVLPGPAPTWEQMSGQWSPPKS